MTSLQITPLVDVPEIVITILYLLYITNQHTNSWKKRTYCSLCEPLNFAGVDEEIKGWVKFSEANLLCITTVVPKNYRMESKFGVTILIKLNILM